jgi:hypothetical protein
MSFLRGQSAECMGILQVRLGTAASVACLNVLCQQLPQGTVAYLPACMSSYPEQVLAVTPQILMKGDFKTRCTLLLQVLLHSQTLSASYFSFISLWWQFGSSHFCFVWYEVLVIYLVLISGKPKILHFETVSPETMTHTSIAHRISTWVGPYGLSKVHLYLYKGDFNKTVHYPHFSG